MGKKPEIPLPGEGVYGHNPPNLRELLEEELQERIEAPWEDNEPSWKNPGFMIALLWVLSPLLIFVVCGACWLLRKIGWLA